MATTIEKFDSMGGFAVGKTVVVRVRLCVVGDFFFVLKSLMWGLLALVKACKAWTILLLPTALFSVTG